MEEKLCFVQFTHPGGEHKPDKGKNYKSWNTRKHQRKFLLSDGDAVIENNLVRNVPLLFWGEWEPSSQIVKTLEKPQGDFPQYIQRPIFENTQSFPRQNTDPFVFNDQFHYFCCKQWRKERPIQTARLAKGSIVLFGSTINQKNSEPYFALDTVLVIDSYIEYNKWNFVSKLQNKVSNDYFEITIKSDCYATIDQQDPTNTEPEVRLYYGANYDNRVSGMYSFVPCKKYNDDNIGFERLKLTKTDFDLITNNLNAMPKITHASNIAENINRWGRLREILKEQDFIEGTHFSYIKK